MIDRVAEITTLYIEQRGKLVQKVSRHKDIGQYAEDIVQSAFERALRYHPVMRDEYPLWPWFNQILQNCIVDHYNAERGVSYEELDEFDFESVDDRPDHHDLVRSLKTLISREREEIQPILELHFLNGYPARDIYMFNKHSYPNVRKIIQRFRDKLKKELV